MNKYLLLLLCSFFLLGWGGNGWKEDNKVTDLTFAPVYNLTSATTPDISGFSYFNTADPATPISNFTSSNLEAGRTIVVHTSGIATYDVTSSTIKGGTADIVSMTDDILTFIYDGTYWRLISYMDMTDDLN